MPTEVKWIKISTNIFNDEAIEIIEQMPEGDAILVIWFKLLVKAGQVNDNGYIYIKKDIPYTEDMLALIFKRPIAIVKLALQTFLKFGMIKISTSNEILISNWDKHQNVTGMEKIKEDTKKRVQNYRERQKQLLLTEQEKVSEEQAKAAADEFGKKLKESKDAVHDKQSAIEHLRRFNNAPKNFLIHSPTFKEFSEKYNLSIEDVIGENKCTE